MNHIKIKAGDLHCCFSCIHYLTCRVNCSIGNWKVVIAKCEEYKHDPLKKEQRKEALPWLEILDFGVEE